MNTMRWLVKHKVVTAVEVKFARDTLNISLEEARRMLIRNEPPILQYWDPQDGNWNKGAWIDVLTVVEEL